ncbi:MAG: NADP-specific glutamate dehydrogenase [Paracoccaceae bacterium]
MSDPDSATRDFMEALRARNPHEPEFHQAAEEIARSVMPWYLDQSEMRRAGLLERLTEPDRMISFRVAWEDDSGVVRMNRAWRVQFSHALGPYKGGLRFAPEVGPSVLKFLGLEQVLKNALTGLPMGGAKGGADFDPHGASRAEIGRFCRALMAELHRHIGPDMDVPAGDIGVGPEEISLMFGEYLKLTNTWTGALTGKGCSFGGSAVRVEATGYGCVYFCEMMLEEHDHGFEGKRVAISGSGHVALFAAEKAIDHGGQVVSLSDSNGLLVCEAGISQDLLDRIKRVKLEKRGRLADCDSLDGAVYREGETPWGLEPDIALPCATQNELDAADAEALVAGGLLALCEGANMPLTPAAAERLREAGVLHGPGKAANAGGVAVSGLEQTQNAQRLSWSRAEVDRRLQEIMRRIHGECLDSRLGEGPVSYPDCANLAGFRRAAAAMHSFGVY